MILLSEKTTLYHSNASFYNIIEPGYFQNIFSLNRSSSNDNVFEKVNDESFELSLNSNFESKTELVLNNYPVNDVINNIYVLRWSNYTMYNDFETFNYIPDFETFKKNQASFEKHFNIKFSQIKQLNNHDFYSFLFNNYFKVDEYILDILNKNANGGFVDPKNYEYIMEVFTNVFTYEQKKVLKLINFF